jgi:hypothetical protein
VLDDCESSIDRSTWSHDQTFAVRRFIQDQASLTISTILSWALLCFSLIALALAVPFPLDSTLFSIDSRWSLRCKDEPAGPVWSRLARSSGGGREEDWT